MSKKKTITSVGAILILITTILLASCSGEIAVVEDPTATPTPTKVIQLVPPTQTETPSKCADLAGELEVQVLVGPAEVVGLTPHSAGSIPFYVTTSEIPYLVQGNGQLEYYDEILVEDWGTYQVTMEMQITIDGECIESGELHLYMEMTGSQNVEVTSPDFHGEYPWSGTTSIDLVLPMEEGASVEGEGYVIVLHIN